MDTSTIIGIVVGVVVVLLLVALISSFAGKRRKQQHKVQAEELRGEAAGRTTHVQDAQLKAQAAEADAQRSRAAAERAEAAAAEARQGADVERAVHEDKVREADRIDPDVDHQADDYRPAPAGSPGHDGQAPVADVNQVPDTRPAAQEPPFDPELDTGRETGRETGPTTGPTTEPPTDGAHRA